MVSKLTFLWCRGMMELVSILESASAGLLADPLMWRMSVVNWATKSRCLACLGE